MQIVLARYREDISWAEGLPALVYSKGGFVETSLPVVLRPNIGREAETYLRHIVTNYDNLADKTLFTQGRVDDHLTPDVTIEKLLGQPEEMTVPFLTQGWECDKYGYLIHYAEWLEKYRNGTMRRAKLPMVKWFAEYIGSTLGKELVYTPGAIFCVSRDIIRRRPLEYYQRLLATVSDHPDPEEAYYMERAWIYIFADFADRRTKMACLSSYKNKTVTM